MKPRRPLRWRVLDQVDRVRDTADFVGAMAITVLAIGWTTLPHWTRWPRNGHRPAGDS